MLSIYIGNKEITLISGCRKKQAFYVDDAVKIAKAERKDNVLEDLRNAIKKRKIKTKGVSFILDSQNVTVKFLQLPEDTYDVESAVNADLRHLNVDKRYYAVSYKEFGKVEVGGKLSKNIMMIIAEKDIIIDCIEYAHGLGLPLVGIEVVTSSLDKIVGGKLLGCNVLLTSHDEELFVTLYKDNQMLLNRHVQPQELIKTVLLCQQFLYRIDKNLTLSGIQYCLNLPESKQLVNLVSNTFNVKAKQLFSGDMIVSKTPLCFEEFGFAVGALDPKTGINLLSEFSSDTSLSNVYLGMDMVVPTSEIPLLTKRLYDSLYLSFAQINKFSLDKKL